MSYVCKFCERDECGRCSSEDCACCGDAGDYYAIQSNLEKGSEQPVRYALNDW